MKKLALILLVSFLSQSTFSSELKSKNEIARSIDECIAEHIIKPLYIDIFGSEPETIEIKKNRYVRAYSKSGIRFINFKSSAVSYLMQESFRMSKKEVFQVYVNDTEKFDENDFIGKQRTKLWTEKFPRAVVQNQNQVSYDNLGNRYSEYQGSKIISITDKIDQIIDFRNMDNNRMTGLSYDKYTYMACLNRI